MAKVGIGLTQNELDDLARLLCSVGISAKDKEMVARRFVEAYDVTRSDRFVRLATIPGHDEDL